MQLCHWHLNQKNNCLIVIQDSYSKSKLSWFGPKMMSNFSLSENQEYLMNLIAIDSYWHELAVA